ncbi:hypothetical protein JDV02_009638 [Purpureocillium takamizusanense]|uniref:N-acetyltransferase domain-containing protein n=1 Tax=Purpureocillium takamizusanense TaxID=2060973 RepID=A0A9Q8QME6_9HYPO|nr:uncharacterized protein JDV02_009638 [Purpureocillium takamizusanense]UNI23844.1 hypothetical protein JDV02_009638 [Purpureocillium takamizusanense]
MPPSNKPYDPAEHLADAYRSARLQYLRADADDARFLEFVPLIEQDPVTQAHASPTVLQPKGRRQFDEYAAGVAASLLGVMICLLPEEEEARRREEEGEGHDEGDGEGDDEEEGEEKDGDNKDQQQQQHPRQKDTPQQKKQKQKGTTKAQSSSNTNTTTRSHGKKTPAPPTIVGVICLGWGGVNASTAHHRGSHIGVSLAAAHQGRGYGREAIDWTLDWAFRHAGMHTVGITAASYNARACGLYERMGFVREGRRRETIWMDRGWHDEIEFGMTEGEWEVLRGRGRNGDGGKGKDEER